MFSLLTDDLQLPTWLVITLVIVSQVVSVIWVFYGVSQRKKARRTKAILKFYRALDENDWFQDRGVRHEHFEPIKPESFYVVIDDVSGFQTELHGLVLAFAGNRKFEKLLQTFMETRDIDAFDDLMTLALSKIGAKHEVWRGPTLSDSDLDMIESRCLVCNPTGDGN